LSKQLAEQNNEIIKLRDIESCGLNRQQKVSWYSV